MASPLKNPHLLNVLSGSLFSVGQGSSSWSGRQDLHDLAPASLSAPASAYLLSPPPSILCTVFQKSKTLSTVRYILISGLLKCKTADTLESIKHFILHSSENRTVCTLPRCHAVPGLTSFFFLAVYYRNFQTLPQVGRLILQGPHQPSTIITLWFVLHVFPIVPSAWTINNNSNCQFSLWV